MRDFDFRKRDQIAKVAAKPPGSAEEGDLPNSGAKSRRALAPAVIFQGSWYRWVALNVVAVQIWLLTFPPPL